MNNELNNLHEIFLRLILTPTIGAKTALNLINFINSKNYKDYEILFNSPSSLNIKLSKLQIEALQILPTHFLEYIKKHNSWLAQSDWHHFITILDANYPKQLLDLDDAPIALYIKAKPENLHQLNQISIAIVGSRKATHQGLDTAYNFARQLSPSFPVISGLAEGIDAKAHEGALMKNQATIAVIGTGIDIIYPSKNKELAYKIIENGCIISDFLLGEAPKPANFPRRNRLIAALCKGIIVVEANLQSGSLITARLANELGRDVFAVPNSIYAPSSKGCHALIKQGAVLLESVQDILDEWWIGNSSKNININPKIINSNSPSKIENKIHDQKNCQNNFNNHEKIKLDNNLTLEQKLMQIISFNPISIDKLSEILQTPVNDIQSALFIIEMNGDIIKAQGSNMYQRNVS